MLPKLFIHSREGTFDADARKQVARALTDLGMECERLADTPKVRGGVWVQFTGHSADEVYGGGEEAEAPLIALIAYAIEGGLDATTRTKFIAEATKILSDHARQGPPPTIYVVIQETPEVDWGMDGEQVSLADLRSA